jgi:hypothetical protein
LNCGLIAWKYLLSIDARQAGAVVHYDAGAFVEAFVEVAGLFAEEAFDDGDIAVLHAAGVPFEVLVCKKIKKTVFHLTTIFI